MHASLWTVHAFQVRSVNNFHGNQINNRPQGDRDEVGDEVVGDGRVD